MDEMKKTIGRLREMLTEQLHDENANQRHSDHGAQVREHVMRLLRRKDLRISTEVMLNDLRNIYSGYEALDDENRTYASEEALHIIENVEALIASEQALNSDRVELGEPPASVAELIGNQERVLRQKEKAQKERLRAERNKHRPPRRPMRPAKKVGEMAAEEPDKASRSELAFNKGEKKPAQREPGRRDRDRGGQRGRKPSGPQQQQQQQTAPQQAKPAAPQQQSGGEGASPEKRKSRRGGRRRGGRGGSRTRTP